MIHDRQSDKHVIFWSGEAEQLRESALQQSALIGKVNDAASNEQATRALESLHALTMQVEKSRVALKEPILRLGRQIDDTAKDFCKELTDEKVRIATLLGDYAEIIRMKLAAEEQARNERLTTLERACAEDIAKSTSVEEADAIREKYSEAARDLPTAFIPKPEGQVVKNDWDVIVVDLWTLARTHPTCVKIEPRLSEIKALLNAGSKVNGVIAKRAFKASIRLKPLQKAIEA